METLKTNYELLKDKLRKNNNEIENIDADLDTCQCMMLYGRAMELEEENKDIIKKMNKIKASNNYVIDIEKQSKHCDDKEDCLVSGNYCVCRCNDCEKI